VSAPFPISQLEAVIRETAAQRPTACNPKYKGIPANFYVDRFGERCVIGESLHRMAYPVADSEADAANYLSYDELARIRELPCSDWVTLVQRHADRGISWSQAVAKADRVVELLDA
jgi:hypothetical protein